MWQVFHRFPGIVFDVEAVPSDPLQGLAVFCIQVPSALINLVFEDLIDDDLRGTVVGLIILVLHRGWTMNLLAVRRGGGLSGFGTNVNIRSWIRYVQSIGIRACRVFQRVVNQRWLKRLFHFRFRERLRCKDDTRSRHSFDRSICSFNDNCVAGRLCDAK